MKTSRVFLTLTLACELSRAADAPASTAAGFVPEPGFTSLFNGRDLTGWAGRPEHWTVQDQTLTGRSTAEKPARGNNFLIAQVGGTNRWVDDFELRFRYRIVANNNSGFANSGVQYRSVDRGNFVVAGYQADFEAGSTYSGILYDEGGGAGGRGIMAERGQAVSWDAAGTQKVTRQLGKSAEIQARIRANEWNDYTIIAQGSHLQHFINGVATIDVVDETAGKRLKAGVLALQLHAGEPMTVQFKDLRLKPLGSPASQAGAAVRVPPDFKLESIYTVPKETEGSWVAMCLEPKGRLYVSDQYGALRRVTLPMGPGESVRTEKVPVELTGAHGLLWAFNSLYVAVNEGDKRKHGVYRVRDTNGDDVLDQVELLREVSAGGEHGLHSLVLSPDGKSIYVVIGNQSKVTDFAASRVPKNWGEDQLLPRLNTGFMDDSLAPQGWIASMDPDGKKWELISIGLRNEFDVAFNTDGELFTYDADMEWDIGSPWYRPTRVNHVISGSEFGFRNGNAKWPDYYPDSFGSVVDVGPGCPTGIGFGYGAKFPARYQNALFLADWSFGKLRAVHLKPDGATYGGEIEEFISGQPFPVTDFVVHPRDGAMYLAVGGRGVQSALYRISYTGTESTAPAQAVSPGGDKRALRHQLEAFHGHADASAVATLWPHLDSADRSIRYAARIALEWQPVAQWQERALTETSPRKALAALLALVRVSGLDATRRSASTPANHDALRGQMLASLGNLSWADLKPAERIELMRVCALTFIRLGAPGHDVAAQLAERAESVFPTQHRETDLLLAQILAYVEAPGAATKLVAALRVAPTQEEQVEYAQALRGLKTGWTPSLREEYFRWFLKAQAYRGGNTFASSIRSIREQAVASLPAADKAALQAVLDAKAPVANPRAVLAARPFVKDWKLEELVPVVEQGLRGGRDFAAGRRIYSEVACSACHRFMQDGGSVGPELTGLVGRFSVRDVLEAIIDPSKVISDQYGAIIVEKTDGDVLTGRVANLSGNDLHIVEDMFDPGHMTSISRAKIKSIEPATLSMMPTGLLNTLKANEVADLIAYLFARGDSQHAMFRP